MLLKELSKFKLHFSEIFNNVFITNGQIQFNLIKKNFQLEMAQ